MPDLKDTRVRREIERSQGEAAAKQYLSPADYHVWRSYSSTWREPIWLNKRFRIHRDGVNLCNFTVVDCDCEFEFGINVKLKSNAGEEQWLTHSPSRLFGFDVFGWVPFLPEVRYLNNGHGSARSLSFPITFRAQFNSREKLVTNSTYVQNVAP